MVKSNPVIAPYIKPNGERSEPCFFEGQRVKIIGPSITGYTNRIGDITTVEYVTLHCVNVKSDPNPISRRGRTYAFSSLESIKEPVMTGNPATEMVPVVFTSTSMKDYILFNKSPCFGLVRDKLIYGFDPDVNLFRPLWIFGGGTISIDNLKNSDRIYQFPLQTDVVTLLEGGKCLNNNLVKIPEQDRFQILEGLLKRGYVGFKDNDGSKYRVKEKLDSENEFLLIQKNGDNKYTGLPLQFSKLNGRNSNLYDKNIQLFHTTNEYVFWNWLLLPTE